MCKHGCPGGGAAHLDTHILDEVSSIFIDKQGAGMLGILFKVTEHTNVAEARTYVQSGHALFT